MFETARVTRLTATLFLLFITLAAAETEGNPGGSPRPKVALVLAGGGARGFVHIGALKVIEEIGLPVDCVVGTSMGSVIGCFYALGYTAAEMEAVVTAIDWGTLLIDSIPRSAQTFPERKNSRTFPAVFGFDDSGFAVASGLTAGQRIMDFLSGLTLAHAAEGSFSDLPREYRAVAADVASGEEVVLSSGSLVDAMRASMAVPGVFTPHEVDGRFLADGMLVKNLPVSAARDLGADIVIAVDIGRMTIDPKEVDSPGASLDRMLSIYINQNRAPERKLADLLIEPEAEEFSSGSFGAVRELIARGEAAARKAEPELRRIAERVKAERPGAPRTVVRREPVPVTFGRIETPGAGPEERKKLLSAFAPYTNRAVHPEEIRAAVGRLYEAGGWEYIRFSFRNEPAGTTVLVVKAKPKRKQTVRIGLGLAYDGRMGLGSDASWNDMETDRSQLAFNLTLLDAAVRNSLWSTTVVLEEPGAAESEFLLRGPGDLFIAPRLDVSSGKRPIYEDMKLTDEYRVRRAAAGLRAGILFGGWGELAAGYEYKRIEASPRFYDENFETRSFLGEVGTAFTALTVDTLSSVPFPEWGTYFSAVYSRAEDWLGSSRYISRLETEFRGYLSPKRGRTFGFHAAGGTAFDGNLDFWNRFFLGGRSSLVGYYENSLSGDHYALFGLEYRHRIAAAFLPFNDIFFLRLKAAAGNVWRGGFPGGSALAEGWRWGCGAGLGINTLLGALNMDAAVSDEGMVIFYISLGMGL